MSEFIIRIASLKRTKMSSKIFGADGKKILPRQLEEDLKTVSQHYKHNAASSNTPRLPQIFDDSAEKAMYDEILGPLINKGGVSRRSFDQGIDKGGKKSVPVESTDFNTSLINRLKIVEKDAADMRKQLAQQLTLNERLHGEMNALKQQLKLIDNKDASNEVLMEFKSYKEKNSKLELQICEMEKFLAVTFYSFN